MALNIKIDFKNRYPIFLVDGLNYSVFNTELVNSQIVPLAIKISSNEHPFMKNVFNMSFGPLNKMHQIDDSAKLTHMNHSKVFSTIVFEGLTFLSDHPDKYLGIDGSNTARAYLYYRCIQNNFDYLNAYFDLYGVNYYVRILRDTVSHYEEDELLAVPQLIEKDEVVNPPKLYNYFIFNMKQQTPNQQDFRKKFLNL